MSVPPPSPRARRPRWPFAVTLGALIAVGSVIAVASATSASWTDRAVVSAPAVAGTWAPTPSPSPSSPGPVGPLAPGQSTALAATTWNVPSDPTATTCFSTQVSTQSSAPVRWSVVIDTKQAPFYGSAALYYTGQTQVNIATQGNRATVTGVTSAGAGWNASWNNATITAGQTLPVTVCTSAPGTPSVADSSSYVTASERSGAWTSQRACVATTVTSARDASEFPFFHGWRAKVDLSDAKDALIAAGGTPTYTSWSPSTSADGYWFSTSPAAGSKVHNSFQLTSGPRAAVKAGQSFTVVTCVMGS